MKFSKANALVVTIAISTVVTLAIGISQQNKRKKDDVASSNTHQPSAPTAQEAHQMNKQGAGADKYRLSAQIDKAVVALGEPVLLRMTLTNNSSEKIYIITTGSTSDSKLNVKDEKGNVVPISERGRKSLEREEETKEVMQEITPGQGVKYELEVGKIYDLSGGETYTIMITRNILLQDKKQVMNVQSNPIKVKIVK